LNEEYESRPNKYSHVRSKVYIERGALHFSVALLSLAFEDPCFRHFVMRLLGNKIVSSIM
jgi:hypothetical protein